MPEKPKRRKNNKNKRKNNRNVRPEINENNPSISLNVPSNDDCSLVNVENNKQVNERSEVNEETFNDVINNIQCESIAENEDLATSEQKLLENEKINYEEPLYVVESPDQTTKIKTKLSNEKKSKSVDNDDSPTIIEITNETVTSTNIDNILPLVDCSNVIISDVESDVQWEKIDELIDIIDSPSEDLNEGTSSITTIPLNIAQCNQTKSLSPEDEDSLRCFLKTLNLSTNSGGLTTSEINCEIEQVINREIRHRLRKKALVEDAFYQKAGPSRSLAVIDEEGSGESSITSRRQSYLNDKKSDNDELEDEVFESKTTQITKRKNDDTKKVNFDSRAIPQECFRVDAKLKEPEVSEARGNWITKTIEKLTGAELVYLTDSSSSTSSIYDLNDPEENAEESDVSVRIITPTIEIIDTEKLLKNNFLLKSDSVLNDSQNGNNETETMLHKDSLKEQKNNEEIFSCHEIIIDSTDNIKTNLFVKDIAEGKKEYFEDTGTNLINLTESKKLSKDIDEYDLKIKVLKCELNDAFNNLITEVVSDTENTKDLTNDLISRQDSSSSLGSSQCTAKYNPTHSSLNDVSNIIHDNNDETGMLSSHVKDVLDHVPENFIQNDSNKNPVVSQPVSMRDLCLQRISLLPYGDKIIEELAQVSERLQNLSSFANSSCLVSKDNIVLSPKSSEYNEFSKNVIKNPSRTQSYSSNNVPPPVKPRKSSLKKSQEECGPATLSKSENVYGCLSPSQKNLMEKMNTIVNKDEESLVSNLNDKNIKHNKTDVITTGNKLNSSPFKSQTGSRLMSLICDSSLKNNVNSVLLKSFNKDLDELPKNRNLARFPNLESKNEYPAHNPSHINAVSASSIFRPLSPPKAKLFSSSFNESDGGSNFTEISHKTMQNEKKYFHFSTGNLNKEIEDDISCIQNMHKYYTNIRNEYLHEFRPRRPSLPKDLCDQQMEYIRQKEQEVDAEIRRLEQESPIKVTNTGPRAPMLRERESYLDSTFNSYNLKTFKARNPPTTAAHYKNSLFSSSEEELLREKMYSEYVNQMAEREFRREQKVIKMTKPTTVKSKTISKSMPVIDILDSKVNNRIEREFITKARERWDKLGIRDSETEDERDLSCDVYREPKVIEHKIKVLEAGEERDVTNLPNHLQDFVKFTVKERDKETDDNGESEPEKQSAHVVVLCAVIILMMTVGKYFIRLLQNK